MLSLRRTVAYPRSGLPASFEGRHRVRRIPCRSGALLARAGSFACGRQRKLPLPAALARAPTPCRPHGRDGSVRRKTLRSGLKIMPFSPAGRGNTLPCSLCRYLCRADHVLHQPTRRGGCSFAPAVRTAATSSALDPAAFWTAIGIPYGPTLPAPSGLPPSD